MKNEIWSSFTTLKRPLILQGRAFFGSTLIVCDGTLARFHPVTVGE